MARRRFALATAAAVGGLTDDDQLLADELTRRGHVVTAEVWDAADVSWNDFDCVVVRSTWDYHLRIAQFIQWIERLEASHVRLYNPSPMLRWNTDKCYLRDLAALGVPVVPSRWVEQHGQETLAAIVHDEEWEEFVVKPTVSASAHRTWRGRLSEAALLEPNFRATVTHGGLLVQPFLEEIIREGEWSLLFYGGEYSHAALKQPRSDDFRVQREHGGTAVAAVPPQSAIKAATRALRACESMHGQSAYARIDGCIVRGEFTLMEAELIEPDLFLRMHTEAPRRLADALTS